MGSFAGRTFINTDDGVRLEAFFQPRSASTAALLCHPHPLYGGDMENPVVLAMEEAFSSAGFSTLRFNFRGVGMSTGRYGEGVGEELDVLACRRFLIKNGIEKIWAAGYSFGAWVLVRLLHHTPDWAGMILLSPPVDFMTFPEFLKPDSPVFIISGSKDPYCTITSLTRWLGDAVDGVERHIVDGADHFYFGYTSALSRAIEEFIGKALKK